MTATRHRRRGPDVLDRDGALARHRWARTHVSDCELPDPDECSAEVEYTPAGNYNGPDSFTFVADDGNGGTDTATISITVTAVNDKPDAVNDPTNAVAEDTPTTLDVLANDTDPEGDALDIVANTDGRKGTVNILGGGTSVRYIPGANQTGTDTFTYTIEDPSGATDTATVTVQISPQNDPPNAVDDPTNGFLEDVTTLIDPLANDSDPEGDPFEITDAADGAKGVTTIVAGGTDISYDPSPNANGTDSFTYTIDDGNGGTDTATVTVQITSVNDAPSGANATIGTTEDTAYIFAAADFGFTDPADSPANTLASVRVASLPAAGSLTLSGGAVAAGSSVTLAQLTAGSFRFTPAANGSGTGYASFTFQVQDNGGTTNGGVNLDPDPEHDHDRCHRRQRPTDGGQRPDQPDRRGRHDHAVAAHERHGPRRRHADHHREDQRHEGDRFDHQRRLGGVLRPEPECHRHRHASPTPSAMGTAARTSAPSPSRSAPSTTSRSRATTPERSPRTPGRASSRCWGTTPTSTVPPSRSRPRRIRPTGR